MTVEERNEISQKWGAVDFTPTTDYSLIWRIFAVTCFIVIIFIYWNRRLSQEVARRKQAEISVRESAAQLSMERDLLEQRVVERTVELSTAKNSAEVANSAKSDFLANMSHELRTPLNAILGLSNIISRTELSFDQRECIRNLIQSSNLLLNIINDILDYSKVDAGRLELESVAFSLRQLLDAVAAVISANINGKDIEILIGASPDIPDILVGDSLRLQQILINLIGNAIKFTEVGEIAVQVGIVEQSCDLIKLRFEVRDTGMGISPDIVQRLFTPFTQGDASTTRRFGGSGLGLAICGKLVRLMAGEIDVESNPGHGSTFWFTAAFALGNPPPELTDKRACCTNGDLSVLIVDDNPAARTIISDTIASLGWRPDCAESGMEAIDKLNLNQNYEFILVDWRMPGMDGLETIRAIRAMQNRNRAPVIAMVTAYDRDEAFKANGGTLVDNILVKPLTSSMLYDLVSSNCQNTASIPGSIINRSFTKHSLAGALILLVEDNTINQDVARRILELEHAKVTIANNGQEAIALLQNCPTAYDVVLMDIQMPVMDGYEATRLIRSSLCLPDLPIIALSAGVMASDRQKAEAAGVNGFIPKPFDVNQLVSMVARYCGRQSMDNSPAPSSTTRNNSIFDTADALNRAGGNRALCRSLLIRFTEQLKYLTVELSNLVKTLNIDEVISRIHTLRGVAGNVGARRLSHLAGDIEDMVRRSPGDLQLAHLDALMSLATETIAAIEKSPLLNAYATACTPESGIEQAKLKALLHLLEESDISAIDAFSSISASVKAQVGDELHQLIEKSVSDLDFSTALEQLSKMISDGH